MSFNVEWLLSFYCLVGNISQDKFLLDRIFRFFHLNRINLHLQAVIFSNVFRAISTSSLWNAPCEVVRIEG